MKKYTTDKICRVINGVLDGDPTIIITGVEEISQATTGQLTLIGEKKYIKQWNQSEAPAAIVSEKLNIETGPGRALIRVADADLALVEVLKLFQTEPPKCAVGIHPAAAVDPTATISEGAAVGAGCYVGPGCVIGKNTVLYPNVTVLDDAVIGCETIIWSGTVIRDRCKVGNHCILHPNVTIGADGFGYRPSLDGQSLVKIPQIGTVQIGDDVEIGAGSCIDRGKFSATTIGDGTKIDNHVQIGHNCKLGRCCIMAGAAGLAGSVTLGDGVIMGGGARVKDHITIGDGVRLGGNASVINDVAPGKTLLGTPADDHRNTLRLWAAQKQLPDLIKKIKKMVDL